MSEIIDGFKKQTHLINLHLFIVYFCPLFLNFPIETESSKQQ